MGIFAHEGFCVYEALAHRDMIRVCVFYHRVIRYTMNRFIVEMTNQVERTKCVSLRNNKQQNQLQA